MDVVRDRDIDHGELCGAHINAVVLGHPGSLSASAAVRDICRHGHASPNTTARVIRFVANDGSFINSNNGNKLVTLPYAVVQALPRSPATSQRGHPSASCGGYCPKLVGGPEYLRCKRCPTTAYAGKLRKSGGIRLED